jgi:hypothetical protein
VSNVERKSSAQERCFLTFKSIASLLLAAHTQYVVQCPHMYHRIPMVVQHATRLWVRATHCARPVFQEFHSSLVSMCIGESGRVGAKIQADEKCWQARRVSWLGRACVLPTNHTRVVLRRSAGLARPAHIFCVLWMVIRPSP